MCKIQFSVSGYFIGNLIYTYTISGDKADWSLDGFWLKDLKLPEYESDPKQEVLDYFRMLHIGEWKHRYGNPNVYDGIEWKLVIEYSNGRKPAKYYGINAFPFNFDEFSDFMGYNPYSDDEEEICDED